MLKKIVVLLSFSFSSFSINAQCIENVYLGAGYTLAKKPDGTLWGSGQNNWGQLGTGTISGQSIFSFVQVNDVTNWNVISAGYNHVASVKQDGTLWMWGGNQMGQIGDNTTDSKAVPVKIGNSTNWKTVAAGYYFTLAIKTDGTLWAWGFNNYGQLGIGNYTEKHYPVQVGTATSWDAVWAGNGQVIARTISGDLYAWGANGLGQLGDGTNDNKTLPVPFEGTGWSTFALGSAYSLGLKSDGTLWAWGTNANGQLGDGTYIAKTIPVQIGTGADWTTVSAGQDSAIALKADGTIWTWGNNANGQLGTGFVNVNRNVPGQVGNNGDWEIIAASSFRHMFALKHNGEVWSWGSNSGELANGSFGTEDFPVQVACMELSVAGKEYQNNIEIYPNPANTVLYIDSAGSAIDGAVIYDLSGRVIAISESKIKNIEINHLPVSVYILEIYSNGIITRRKFIKN